VETGFRLEDVESLTVKTELFWIEPAPLRGF
jgi:hypothetical protein